MAAAPTVVLVTCPGCGHEFPARLSLVGQRVECGYCARQVPVPPPSDPADLLIGRTIAGCLLLRRIGAGGLGRVYEAEQRALGRRVAVKLLHPKSAENPDTVLRFGREAKLAAEIHHPNVVEVYDCGQERGVNYLVMEYVPGCTLAEVIRERGRLPWQEAAGWMLQIAKALENAHRRGVVHRDIKPANILIHDNGTAKLSDLGLAKKISSDGDPAQALTMAGVPMGSPAFMSPEQIRSARDVTPAADIYSLGVTIWCTLVGEKPFTGRSSAEVLGRILREEPPPLTSLVGNVPAGVVDLVAAMMAKNPADRPADATALIADIEATLAAPMVVRPRRRSRSDQHRRATGGAGRRALWIALGLAALVVLTAAFFVLRP